MKTMYRIEDRIVDTSKATFSLHLDPVKSGYGHYQRSLYRSQKGRWYLVHDFDGVGDGRSLDYAEWLSPQEAARLLLQANEPLPDFEEVVAAAEEVCE